MGNVLVKVKIEAMRAQNEKLKNSMQKSPPVQPKGIQAKGIQKASLNFQLWASAILGLFLIDRVRGTEVSGHRYKYGVT